MKVPDDVKCKICAAVFCCGKCREKHEDKAHKEAKAIRQICYICNNRPFPLRADTKITAANVLVEHILREHLPLRCNRCTKVFHTVADFKSIARCFNTSHSKDPAEVESVCHLEHNPNIPTILEQATASPREENKENIDDNSSSDCSGEVAKMAPPTAIKVVKALSTSELIQPLSKELRAIVDPPEALGEVNEAMLTPLSMINLRWKRKSRQSFDSMNNISAVNVTEGAVVLPTSPGKKLTRSTSTPMMHGCLPQNLKVLGVGEESYSCAMGQMSSIHSNSGSESDSRGTNNNTPNSPTSYELNKVRAIARSKSKVAATPLRQVMSKSIQRAIAQHGYIRMIAPGTQRKMSFSSSGSLSGLSSTSGSPSRSMALDLRTTPVLKRTSSEGCAGSRNAKMIRLEAKSQSEDSSGGSTLEESSSLAYYDTHQNAESLNQSIENGEEEQENHYRDNQNQRPISQLQPPNKPSCYNETPKVVAGGGILKKVISFSPEKTRVRIPPEEEEEDQQDSDVWSTPCAIPTRSYSCSALKDLRSSNSVLLAEAAGDSSDDVFATAAPVIRSKSCKQLKSDGAPSTGKLWTIVSSVIRLASRQDLAGSEDSSGDGGRSDSENKFSATSLAKKAVSFAGFLRNRLPSGAAQLSRRNSSSGSDEFSPSARGSSSGSGQKRRRAASIYARPYESLGKTSSSPLAKRKRIQGRQPIERMRTNSSRSGSGSDF